MSYSAFRHSRKHEARQAHAIVNVMILIAVRYLSELFLEESINEELGPRFLGVKSKQTVGDMKRIGTWFSQVGRRLANFRKTFL